MPSEWAMKKADSMISLTDPNHGDITYVHSLKVAAALDAAREEGAREMRGKAADVCTASKGYGISVVAEDVAEAIRALPLPGADTRKGG